MLVDGALKLVGLTNPVVTINMEMVMSISPFSKVGVKRPSGKTLLIASTLLISTQG